MRPSASTMGHRPSASPAPSRPGKGNLPVLVCRFLVVLTCIALCRTGDLPARQIRESGEQVWQVGTKRWNIEEEQRFAKWVEDKVDEDFFLRYQIPVDCADVPYAIRWIYARIAHLPAAATTADGRLIGNWSTAWHRLPTDTVWYHDRRFRMALLYMLAETSTRTLPADTYPIRIAPDSVMAGAVFLSNGHAGIIGRIVLDGSTFSPVQTWEATLPVKVRKLRQKSYFAAWADSTVGTGLVRFRWPVSSGDRWRYLPERDHPFYSLEEYGPGFCHAGESFDDAVARRIDTKKYDPAKRAGLMMDSIYHYIQERVPLVLAGHRRCRRADCSEGSSLWEAYSTPGRDDMIAFKVEHLLKIIRANRLDQQAIERSMQKMVVPIGDGRTVTLDYVVRNYLWLSPDPGDSIEARWGLDKCNTIRNRMRSALRDLSFVEQRYQLADPAYAAYGRSLYLTDLQRLQEAGKLAGCSDLPPLSAGSP